MSATVPHPVPPSMASRSGRVVANEVVSGGAHRIEFEVAGGWPATRAGQFVMLSLDDPEFPLLPRPFSLLGCQSGDEGEADHVEFLVMPVGKGSGLICSVKVGAEANLVGPMGHAVEADVPEGPLVCVAGGYGVAPFIFLLEQWTREGRKQGEDVTVVFGARTKERLSLADRLEASASRVLLCTDDGSKGLEGRVDEALTNLLQEESPAMILTCGPEAMMEAVGKVAVKAQVPARASLETVMGCGYAVCNGCAVAVHSDQHPEGYTYELACREGTVFDESRLLWHPL